MKWPDTPLALFVFVGVDVHHIAAERAPPFEGVPAQEARSARRARCMHRPITCNQLDLLAMGGAVIVDGPPSVLFTIPAYPVHSACVPAMRLVLDWFAPAQSTRPWWCLSMHYTPAPIPAARPASWRRTRGLVRAESRRRAPQAAM